MAARWPDRSVSDVEGQNDSAAASWEAASRAAASWATPSCVAESCAATASQRSRTRWRATLVFAAPDRVVQRHLTAHRDRLAIHMDAYPAAQRHPIAARGATIAGRRRDGGALFKPRRIRQRWVGVVGVGGRHRQAGDNQGKGEAANRFHTIRVAAHCDLVQPAALRPVCAGGGAPISPLTSPRRRPIETR